MDLEICWAFESYRLKSLGTSLHIGNEGIPKNINLNRTLQNKIKILKSNHRQVISDNVITKQSCSFVMKTPFSAKNMLPSLLTRVNYISRKNLLTRDSIENLLEWEELKSYMGQKRIEERVQ